MQGGRREDMASAGVEVEAARRLSLGGRCGEMAGKAREVEAAGRLSLGGRCEDMAGEAIKVEVVRGLFRKVIEKQKKLGNRQVSNVKPTILVNNYHFKSVAKYSNGFNEESLVFIETLRSPLKIINFHESS